MIGINMEWSLAYNSSREPTMEEIRTFIGKAALLWTELLAFLEETYHVPAKISYSSCSAQPGWNVKYQKSGKSLCTLYPMDGYFTA